ncbi:THAP domain-containing protein 5-like [Scomber scombrus]|uniref:THAP domain-containing protein 5-like n=1 Tax=Scomber scombrus TaxID=13677 RepID=UPI002DD83A22|nr:THAP domain-containing protein 5-like [Scomber scombrus]
MKRKDWTPNTYSRLCSMHFTEDQFFTPQGKRRLTKTAVATIFNFPPHLLKKTTTMAMRTKLVSMIMEVSDSLVCTSVPSCSSSSYLTQPPNRPGPVTPSCPVLDDEAVADFDNGDSGSNADHNNAIVEENTAEKTNVVDGVLHDDIVMIDVHADVEEAVTDDITECTTSVDSQSILPDHNYICTTQKHNVAVFGDHSYKTLKRRANAVQDQLFVARKKLRLKHQQTRRLKSKLSSLKGLTKVLQKKLLISSECAALLDSINDVPRELLRRIQLKKKSATFCE